jgi:hypothetical protein
MSEKRRGYYEHDLDLSLQTWANGYEQDRAAHLEASLESEQEWSELKQLREDADAIASSIHARASALQNLGEVGDLNSLRNVFLAEGDHARQQLRELILREGKAISPENLSRLLNTLENINYDEADHFPPEESDRPLRLIWERLCIEDAAEVVHTIRPRVERRILLDRLVRDEMGRQDVPDACIEFLALVSRCFVYGFVPECVAMCRSAMELAFKEKVSDEHCERANQKRIKNEFDLHARIQAAFDPRNKMLTRQQNEDVYQAADRVKWRGNKVVHEQTDVTKDALGTIKLVLRVIDALARLRTAPS